MEDLKTVRGQIELVLQGTEDLPDRIAMKMRQMADALDEAPYLLAMHFIGEWAALDRRIRLLESNAIDTHDEFQWLHSHLAGFLPGAYLDDEEDDDDE